MQFLIDHCDEILAFFGALYTCVSIVVALTPSKADDAWLARVMQRVSFLAPKNVPGVFSVPGRMPRDNSDPIGPMLVLALVLVGTQTSCAHRQAIKAFVRGTSCGACEALGGSAGCDAEGEE